jgi:predicted dehydrogenase
VEEECSFAELRGTRAGCSLRNGAVKLFSETADHLVDLSPKLMPRHEYGDHGANLWHFVEVVQNKASPIITPEDGVSMIRILAAIYASAKSGNEVRLEV